MEPEREPRSAARLALDRRCAGAAGVLALVIVRVPFVWDLMAYANNGVQAIEIGRRWPDRPTCSATLAERRCRSPWPKAHQPPVIIAFQILPLIIVLSTLSALLWHWGMLRAAVRGLAWAAAPHAGVSGVVGLGGGGTMFLGVVESPLVVRAWFERMSRAELFAVMVLVMATISGAILCSMPPRCRRLCPMRWAT
jgi:concentrative nucleoside transporter, CNT family